MSWKVRSKISKMTDAELDIEIFKTNDIYLVMERDNRQRADKSVRAKFEHFTDQELEALHLTGDKRLYKIRAAANMELIRRDQR